LRVCQRLLQDENDDLHEQLYDEEARLEELEGRLDNALMEVDEHKATGEMAQKEIRMQSREVANLKVRYL
jgi:predicted RNase H-like nuclease (RuvC/YqgF family)